MPTDIRLSTLSRRASTVGVTILGYMSGGKPTGLDPTALYPTPAEIGAATTNDLNGALVFKQNVNEKGLANGYAALDSAGKVPAAQLPTSTGGGASLSDAAPAALGGVPAAGGAIQASRADHIHPLPSAADIGAATVAHTHAITGVVGLQTALDAKLPTSQKGALNGVASLGADGKVPNAQLPPGLSQSDLDAKADAAATTNALSLKADLTYTNNQLATKLNSNDTRITNAIQPDFLNVPVTFSAGFSAAQSDNNKIRRCIATGDVTVTLPSLSVGTTIRFTQGAAGRITFAAGSGQTLESVGNVVTTNGKGSNVIATVQASNLWNLAGNLV